MQSQLTAENLTATQASASTAKPSPIVVMPNLVSPARVLMAGLGLGMLFDVLFYGKMLGISVPLFVASIAGVLFWLGREEDVRPRIRNMWLLLPLLFFATMVVFRANEFLTIMNLLAVVFLMSLLAYFYAAGRLDKLGLLGYYLTLMTASLHALLLPAPLVPKSTEGRHVRGMERNRWAPVLRGLLLALPVLFVFTALLSSADMIFANLVLEVLSLDFMPDLSRVIGQITVALVVGWLMAGGLAYALGRRDRATPNDDEPWDAGMDSVPRQISIGIVEVSTLLVLVSSLFLAFGLIQFAYLFGGESQISAAGLTYAEYARRGFFELVAVSVLTLGLILALHHLARRDDLRQRLVFNGLASLMVALVLVLLASAYWRMSLYEQAYGYTHLRLYVQVFELWLALSFGWLLLTLWWKPRYFAIGAFVAAMGFLASLNLINPDATLARENLDRYRATGNLDAYYLAGLSEDAVPELLPALDYVVGNEGVMLQRALTDRFGYLSHNADVREWQALHWSRIEALEVLSANRDALSPIGTVR